MSVEDLDYPQAWRPEPGDKLVGEVTDIEMLPSKFGGADYPCVTVRTDADREFAFHGYHTVARSELGRRKPKAGDGIGIRYFSLDEKGGYEKYRNKVERPEAEGTPVDWDKVAPDAQSELDNGEMVVEQKSWA